ncbi:hypothetical protein ACEPAG_3946 [Sanghuangporus baumii]
MSSRLLVAFLVALAAVFASFYQFSLRPKLIVLGWGRTLKPVLNTQCKSYPEVQACEKIVLHQPTGLVYMACSTQQSRPHWMPATNRLNATGKSSEDYVATFDPSTSRITRLRAEGFKFPRGLSLHGMDVVASKERPSELLLYLVNHREPLPPANAMDVGTDSVVEVFRSIPGADEMHYVATFQDPVISTPNDIYATGDDASFYFTNDHGFVKAGLVRRLNIDAFFDLGWSNIGYCHALHGCKTVVSNLVGINGIVKGRDGKFFVSSSKSGRIYVLDHHENNTLSVSDVLYLDRTVDNLSMDQTGAIWGAGMVNALHLFNVHFETPSINTPSSAIRITEENGAGDKGGKFKVQTMFEDDGKVASGSTSAVYDAERKKLYLHGIAASHLTVCDIDV